MKDLIYYIVAVGSLLATFYISEPTIREVPLKTSVSGLITNHIDYTVKVYNRNHSFRSRINHKGQFKINIDIDSSAYFNFFHGAEITSMYINPGDNIELTIDTKLFDETINYLNSKESTFLSKKYLIREKYFSNTDSIFNLSDSIFHNFLTVLEEDLYKELNIVSNSVFVELEKEKFTNMIEYYHKRKSALDALPKKGEPAIDFTYPNKDGENISLSDFRDQYVYVDVWATWCAPCRREIPFLVELEKQYHDKNIVFLSVSVDVESAKDSWLHMLEEKSMGGIQLFANEGKQIKKDYAITSIPKFMLFDTDGNVINLTAPRPSSEEIKLLFNEIL